MSFEREFRRVIARRNAKDNTPPDVPLPMSKQSLARKDEIDMCPIRQWGRGLPLAARLMTRRNNRKTSQKKTNKTTSNPRNISLYAKMDKDIFFFFLV